MKPLITKLLSALFWLALWFAIAWGVNNELLLADPLQTGKAILSNLVSSSFWNTVAHSFIAITLAGFGAGFAGAVFGLAASRFEWLKQLLAPAIHLMKSAPVACVIVIVLVAWGSAGALVTIVAFVAFPPFYVAALEAQSARKSLIEDELCLAGLPHWQIFLISTWPSMLPYFISAAKTAVALAWRAGITAEILSLPLGSIGSGIYAAKITLDSAQILTWTATVMVISWLCEYAVVTALRTSEKLGGFLVLKCARRRCSQSMTATLSLSAQPQPLHAERISLAFGEQNVIEQLSVRVTPGERLCLMAPTGSGKTTALHLLLGRLKADEGNVGKPDTIGVVFQEPTLLERLTAIENIELVAAKGINWTLAVRDIETLMPEGTLHKRAGDLSGGSKRLCEIARAMLSPGHAIVMDEPFTGLDEASKQRACEFILARLSDRPFVFTTHNAADAQLLGAKIRRL